VRYVDQADLDAAAALARSTIGVPDDVDALSRPVRRLDRDTSYVLVQLGRAGEPGWVAAVDPRTADVMAWATNATGASTAPEGQGYDGAGEGELVWRPCAQSRSPLYPLLRIVAPAGELFIDLAGRASTVLSDGRG
jgi:hypothetical protein